MGLFTRRLITKLICDPIKWFDTLTCVLVVLLCMIFMPLLHHCHIYINMNIFGHGVIHAGHSLQKELFQVTAFFCVVQIITYRYRAALMRKYIDSWFLLYVLNSIVGLFSLGVIVLISYYSVYLYFLGTAIEPVVKKLLIASFGFRLGQYIFNLSMFYWLACFISCKIFAKYNLLKVSHNLV